MIKTIVDATDPVLRLKSKPIKKFDKKLHVLAKDLKDTLMVQNDPEGIGLAAPQIGKNLNAFVIKPEDEIKLFINPKILKMVEIKERKQGTKNRKKIMEGCLSIPHYYGPLKRPQFVKLKYQDEGGREIIEDFTGLPAQIVQHEVDHLHGVLFVDRLLEQKQKLYEYVDGEWEEVDLII